MNWNFPRKLAVQQFVLGRNADALGSAKSAVARSPINRLSNAGVLSAIQLALGRHESAVVTLTPHIAAIVKQDPNGLGNMYQNLIESLLRSGKLDQAQQVLEMGDISPQLLQHWVTVGKTLDENQALAAFDIFKLHVEPTMSAQIDSVNIATEIARLLNTPVTLERAYDELAILESMVLAEDNIEILAKQKIGLSRGGLQDIKSPSDAQATYLYLINLVPSETVEKFKEFSNSV